ncbi:MAG: hypothetical protein K0S51_1162 [Bacillales bacterium]|jgi:hypothetical protein|nr:hypothetical protein [Bacillales bacterium]
MNDNFKVTLMFTVICMIITGAVNFNVFLTSEPVELYNFYTTLIYIVYWLAVIGISVLFKEQSILNFTNKFWIFMFIISLLSAIYKPTILLPFIIAFFPQFAGLTLYIYTNDVFMFTTLLSAFLCAISWYFNMRLKNL